VKKIGIFPKLVPQQKNLSENRPELFMLCDRSNAGMQFRVEPFGNLDCTIERLAGTLAVQCLVRGQTPEDFTVFVPAELDFVERLVSRTKSLLAEGRANTGSVSLSARQKEILNFVVRNQANKEIASKLNISVRTVKFHISALLEKFGVANRNELARKAAGLLMHEDSTTTRGMPYEERQEVVRPVAVGERLHVPDRRRSIRFPVRKFSASHP
jgi:DNA-binding CsgD family transcriptional regulator